MSIPDPRNAHPPEAPPDERASSPARRQPESAAAPGPRFEPPPLISDCLGEKLSARIADSVEETFPPGSRKPRHDGFTPERIGDFLRHLAATGVVEHAAAAVGVSASAAYAFRNRRQGRAFARMWDAILVNRARDRLASELQSRAIAGCVSVRKRDGEIVGEYHYYDNRLAMALLTRLDRLADKEAASEAHLRALSEDMEEFIDCIAEGGDADAFVAARRPAEPEPPDPAVPDPDRRPDQDPELTTFARLSGCPDYLDVDPRDIAVLDLDLGNKASWDPDQWVRAFRSGFMTWLHVAEEEDGIPPVGLGPAMRFHICREAAVAAAMAPADGDGESVPEEELDLRRFDEWSDDQLARAWRGGLLDGVPDEAWEELAEEYARRKDER
ncbi:MAG TPA: hypothetical protein VD846_03680 [Allosphingosinicella sp.]|nr:hypothetical protein [Allosphingosinicella sp.]